MSIHAVPRLPPRLETRPRLTERLESDAALVVLRAPGGYGKTAALTQWATVSERRGVWLRVREGMTSPAAFVEALATELGDAGILGEENPLRTSAESVTLGDPFDLLQRGLRLVAEPLTIVLDEAELLGPTTVAGLLRLLSEDPGLSLRVATRRSDAFSEPGLALAVDTDVIDVADLTLSADEIAAILGTDASDPAVTFILEHGASPALARIVALAGVSAGGQDAADAVESAIESLLRLRAPSWDHAFVDFLGVVALSEVMDASLAGLLSGRTDAADLLDRAELEGLGYWRVPPSPGDRESALFIPSPVFRRVLERAVRGRMPSRWLEAADRHIARWHLAAGRAYPALQAAVRAKDGALVTDVVRLHWFDLLRSGADVRDLFRGVSALSLRTQPLPTMLLAILWNAHGTHRFKAVEYFTLAAYGARTQRSSASPADRALLGAIESTAHRVSGRTDRAVRSARSTLEVLLEMAPEERARLGRNSPTVYNQIGLSLFYGGRWEEALECFRLSDAVGSELGLRAGLQGLAQLAGTLALTGDVPAARDAIDRAVADRWPDGWRDGYAGSMLRIAEAIIALEGGQIEAAASALRPLAPHRETIEHAGILEYVETLIQLAAGEKATAAGRLARVDREQKRRGRLGGLGGEKLRSAHILSALAQGDHAAADALAEKLATGPDRDIIRARIRLASGDVDAALRHLAGAAWEGADLRTRTEHLALSAGALCLAAQSGGGDAVGASDALSRLGDTIDAMGLTLPLLLLPTAALDALAASAHPKVAAASVRVRGYAFIPSGRATPRLTEREQAVASALVSGETVAEIAARLSVSPNTVKTQMRAVYRKLGVRTREEAVRAIASAGAVRASASPPIGVTTPSSRPDAPESEDAPPAGSPAASAD